MISQRNKIRALGIYLGDILATVSAFFVAYALRGTFPEEAYARLFPLSMYINLLWVIIPVWSLSFYLVGSYSYWRGERWLKETWKIFKAIFLSFLLLGFFIFAFKYQFVSRIFISLFAVADFFLIILFRYLIREILIFWGEKREDTRNIVILGVNGHALELAKSIERNRDLGFRLLGFLSLKDDDRPDTYKEYPVLGKAQDLPAIMDKKVVDEVIFAVTQEELIKLSDLFLLCEERGITTRVVLNLFPHTISKTHLEEMDGFSLLTFSTTPQNELLFLICRIFDIIGSLLLIGALAPIFLFIAISIRLDSPGPIFYRQTRCGLNGRRFTLYKFRSMVADAEERKKDLIHFNLMKGPVFKMKNDPRVTRVGRVLRRLSLDELPQLFNVLKGDMSFVGPRPPIPEEVEKYESWQRRRLSMKPGITGLWQVSGRNEIDFQDWIKLDLEYIDNWSLWLDFKIILKTIPAVLSGKGAM